MSDKQMNDCIAPCMRFNYNERIVNYKMRRSASGVHLFNRKTGTNILLDEVSVPSQAYSLAPRNVSIALTNQCDLNCPFCYAPKNSFTLDFQRLKSWLVDLDENGTLGVGFGGGEPTLHPDFTEICCFASKQTSLAVSFTTHGHTLNKNLLDTLKGHVHFIRISMDGVGAVYERSRNRSFSGLSERLTEIRESGIKFGINYIVNTDTLSCLEEAMMVAENMHATEFLLLPEMPIGNSIGCTDEMLQYLKDWVRGYHGTLRLSVSENSSDGFPVCNPFPDETRFQSFAHIDAEGNLKQTSFDEFGVPIIQDGLMAAFEKLKLQK